MKRRRIRNWFSNMRRLDKPLIYMGLVFWYVENFFQAMKTTDPEMQAMIAALDSPYDAKQAGKQVKLRPGWKEKIQLRVMEFALRHKFQPGTSWHRMLMATGDTELIEWNDWGDTYWGKDIDTGEGENHLGRLLMMLRDEYRRLGTSAADTIVKVFIGGSIGIQSLPSSVTARIDRMIEGNLAILVGDAPGVDRSVQQYLAESFYHNVLVFHSGKICRNNLGGWQTRAVSVDLDGRGFEFYALKDLLMAREADYGLMVWDGKSRGTRNNIRNLLQEGKPDVVFLSSDQSFHLVRNAEDLSNLPV